MSLTTYDGLVAAIIRTANRGTDADFAAAVPDFIALAEAEMRRVIRALSEVQTLDVTIDDDSFPLPCGFDGIVSFNGRGTSPRGWTYVAIDTLDGVFNPTGMNYSLSSDTIYFTKAPGDVRLRYRALFNPLGPRCRCNWVLTNHPDAYLYGALMQAAPYLEDDARLPVWGSLFGKAIDQINRQAINQMNGGPLLMRSDKVPDGGYRRAETYIAPADPTPA